MKRLVMDKGSRAIAIVAHPDDEIIWMGGMIMMNPKVDWTVFSLCRESDDDRRPKFRSVCRKLGVRGIITDFDDEGKIDLKRSVPLMEKIIKKKTGGKKYDYVFTHGQNGEYGHKRHKGAYLAVKRMIKEGSLEGKLLFFNYYKFKKTKKSVIMRKRPDSDYILKLSEKMLERKKKIVADMYGYPYDGIDVGLCTGTEAFKLYK